MQIIIDIDEDVYNILKNYTGHLTYSEYLIKNGTPFPKGHGNIYDENNIKKEIENPYQCQTVLYGLKLVKPIIEADTESEVEE